MRLFQLLIYRDTGNHAAMRLAAPTRLRQEAIQAPGTEWLWIVQHTCDLHGDGYLTPWHAAWIKELGRRNVLLSSGPFSFHTNYRSTWTEGFLHDIGNTASYHCTHAMRGSCTVYSSCSVTIRSGRNSPFGRITKSDRTK